MRGQHRHHQRAVEQRAQLVRLDPAIEHHIDRRGQPVDRPLAAGAQRAQPLALLGDVHQVALQRERAREVLEAITVERGDLGAERRAPTG